MPRSATHQQVGWFEPARELKSHHASILLVFDAVVDALVQISQADSCDLAEADSNLALTLSRRDKPWL
jgi:hypothetical protein